MADRFGKVGRFLGYEFLGLPTVTYVDTKV